MLFSFLRLRWVAARHLGHHRLTLLHREPHPYLQLAVASGGKSHLFRVFFLFEPTIPVSSTFLMSQFGPLTEPSSL
jgi:hypothetical protein